VAAHSLFEGKLLDIGAGTGLLMMMLAQRFNGRIEGIELDPDCAAQMQENISSSPWTERLTGLQGDVRTKEMSGPYGLIVSNPPFYEDQLNSPRAAKNLAWHSTELRISDLLGVVDRYLADEGQFCLLVPFSRLDEVISAAREQELFARRVCRVRHSSNHPFTRAMIIFSRKSGKLDDEMIEIRDPDGNYSAAFSGLLNDYYLFL